MTLRRRLAAALAAASLVLGGALVAPPAAAAAEIVGPGAPVFEIKVDGADHVQPGSEFRVRLEINRLQDIKVEGEDEDVRRQVALVISFPETVEFLTGDCTAYVMGGGGRVSADPKGFTTGDECILPGTVNDPAFTTVLRFRSVDVVVDVLPAPPVVQFEINRTLVITGDTNDWSADDDVDPPAVATGGPEFGAPYLASVDPGDRVTWPDDDIIEVKYRLRAPHLGYGSPPVAAFDGASTTWDLTWPEFAAPVGPGATFCRGGPIVDGHCRVTFTQMAPAVINLAPSLVLDPSQPEEPNPDEDPLAEGCGSDGAGYCDYVLVLRFEPRDISGNAGTGDFTMEPVEGDYTGPGSAHGAFDQSLMAGATTPHTVVERAVETSTALSADARPVGGEDITATITARQFDDVDLVALYQDFGGLLEVHLVLNWPYFLKLAGDPQGCDQWQATQRVCVLRFSESPPGPAKEISATFEMPTEPPPYEWMGVVAASASRVRVVGTDSEEYTLDDAPTSVVIPSEAPFEVYQPFIQTSVTLSSNAGWPGGDDLIATFTIGHLLDSTIDFETGSSVTVHLDWPDFVVLTGDLPCLGFVPDAAPDETGGMCVIDDPGPPGWSEQLTARFTMPGSVDGPVNGFVSIDGVSIVAVTECECSGDQDTTTYDSRYVLPGSAPFVVDTEVFPVDITLDRTVSTPGGLRLYALARVTYDHAMSVDTSNPVVGIDLDWPDFLSLVEPPGISGCDEIQGEICYLTGLFEVGDTQVIELWFDMPLEGSWEGEITAVGADLCDGYVDECSRLPDEWIGEDAADFAVLEPEITVDVSVDRDTGWTQGQPITATATVTHKGAIPGTLPGLTADLALEWPDFLTSLSIVGCDTVVPGGVCRVTGLDAVDSSKQLTLQFGMPPVEVARGRTTPSEFPKTGDIKVSGFAFSYDAAPPTPIPEPEPDSNSGLDDAGATDGSAQPASPPCGFAPLGIECTPALPVLAFASPGQTVTDLTALTPQDLVDTIVGPGVTASNVAYTGSEQGAGLFSGFEVLGFSSGLVLSSGYVDTIPGPNESESETGYLDQPGDPDLDALLGNETVDASVLTFDFVPTSSQVSLEFVFASEEYSEYSEFELHDVFAIFVNRTNCALTPDGEPDGEPVSVATINGGSPLGTDPVRPELYRDNSLVYGYPPSSPLDIEADGLTIVLRCVATVAANETNTMKLAIADAITYSSYGELDSQVFIAAGSVRSNRPPVANDQSVSTDQDTAVDVVLSATDADGDTLTYAVVAQPAHGTLSGIGANLTHIPAAGYSGPDAFTFSANDGAADSNAATVRVVVDRAVPANRAPVATDQSVTTDQDTPVAVTLSATDADDDPLTYAVAAQPSHGTVSGTGANLTYTPSPGYSGPDAFTFTANDGGLDSEPATVGIVVEPVLPPGPVIAELPVEWIGSHSARVTVLQPKVTVLPQVSRPGQVVTIFVENLPEAARITLSWGAQPSTSPVASVNLGAGVTFDLESVLIVRRALLGPRDLTVHSVDGLFGDVHPARTHLVVARSTVADELVGRGG